MLDPNLAKPAAAIKSVVAKITRVDNWLSAAEAQSLLDLPGRQTIKGPRDRALLAVMVFCDLRRSKLAALTIGHLQTREGHHAIADMLGQGNQVWTIKLPVAVRRAVDEWLQASTRTLTPASPVFVAMREGDHVAEGETISAQALHNRSRTMAARSITLVSRWDRGAKSSADCPPTSVNIAPKRLSAGAATTGEDAVSSPVVFLLRSVVQQINLKHPIGVIFRLADRLPGRVHLMDIS